MFTVNGGDTEFYLFESLKNSIGQCDEIMRRGYYNDLKNKP